MKKYKVKITCGMYDAPCIYIDANDDKSAIELAKKQSGLSRFKNWEFISKTI